MLKKGISIWAFKDTPVKECIKLAKSSGYDGIELALNETGEVALDSTEKELLEYKKLAEDIEIEIPSVATGLYWKYGYTSNSPEIRNKAKDITKKQLETAAILGADTILVVPGACGVDFVPNSEIISYDLAYERAYAALSQLKVEVDNFKVSIGVENVWNKFLLSPLEMRDFIDSLNSKYIGSYFDVGNVVYSGYPEHWIRILGNRIKKLHFKDFKRSIGTLSGFVPLLEGDVNFPEVIKALAEINYTSYVTGELFPDQSADIVADTSVAMDKILGR